jgi:chromate transporter
VFRDWGRLGVLGFGGPPAHISLLRRLCVDQRGWIDSREFEDANAACGLLPGPASTQMAIYCARRVAGGRGALVGGLAFIVPGLLAVLGLAAVSLQHAPPDVVRGAAAAAGAAVIAVVVQAGVALAQATPRTWLSYVYMAVAAAVTVAYGALVVLALLGCGLVELSLRRRRGRGIRVDAFGALLWLAAKVGALSYGGGFVIVPLMRSDAVHVHHWMTNTQFLNAVALGQLTPGPVLQTVTAVGYAASGVSGALIASAVAFAPSFVAVGLLGPRFHSIRANPRARAFLDGAGPAAIGAIFGAVVPLLDGIQETWQGVVLALAAVATLLFSRGPLVVLGTAALAGATIGLAGAPLP